MHSITAMTLFPMEHSEQEHTQTLHPLASDAPRPLLIHAKYNLLFA